MRVLTVNAGSSSLKLVLLDGDDTVLARADLAAGPGAREGERLAEALGRMPRPDAVGHRFVHGGSRFAEPVRIDAEVTEELRGLIDLAPTHQPLALNALGETQRALPGVPAVACFDTAFHATLPAAAATYALPAEWRERYGIRRFGFHGLSHSYAARRVALPRVVTCHLGAGASLAAVKDGRSIDTTMGFTPLEGLVMAGRPGSVDPGIPLWLMEHGVGREEIADALESGSGLRGLAGTRDMREVVERAGRDDPDATLALDVYLHRLRASIAAMAASLGGFDALAFTGGVGEHSPAVRARTAAGLGFLGVSLDTARNADARGDAEIGADGAAARAFVIAAREDLEIAAGVRRTLAAG